MQFKDDVEAVDALANAYQGLKSEIGKVIYGQHDVIKTVLISLFCDGHSLLVGVPGLAKTLLVNTISKVLDLEYNRIQFTPDLLPADVVGTLIYNMKENDFSIKKGPVSFNPFLKLLTKSSRLSTRTASTPIPFDNKTQSKEGSCKDNISIADLPGFTTPTLVNSP